MKGRVAVTGATGFVGIALLRHLVGAGWQIRALVHKRAIPADLAACVEIVRGGLTDKKALLQLVKGADAVVHVAGKVRGRSAEDFHAINVQGVESLAEVASTQPIPPRFILISSLAAREPQLSHYAASKREGEFALAQVAADSTMACAVLRPPAVYGPGDLELKPLFDAMAAGFAPLLGVKKARSSVIHVDDLARAIGRLLEQPQVQGCFELHDGCALGYSWDDIADAVSSVTGRRSIRVRVPAALLRTLARLNAFAAGVLNYQPMLSPGKVNELRHPDWCCDNRAFTEATGWQPEINLHEGLRRLLSFGPTSPATETSDGL
ncbi:MAG: epimerase [Gammaproteobacteria bacterium HGW-Gammaproteobacteria-3]|nr:MAG: epimerase [Gammaproteobacteria bacterium HGW-Gammaproteobacteria-3]